MDLFKFLQYSTEECMAVFWDDKKKIEGKNAKELYVACVEELLKRYPNLINSWDARYTTIASRAAEYSGVTATIHVGGMRVYVNTGLNNQAKEQGIKKMCEMAGIIFQSEKFGAQNSSMPWSKSQPKTQTRPKQKSVPGNAVAGINMQENIGIVEGLEITAPNASLLYGGCIIEILKRHPEIMDSWPAGYTTDPERASKYTGHTGNVQINGTKVYCNFGKNNKAKEDGIKKICALAGLEFTSDANEIRRLSINTVNYDWEKNIKL